MFTDNVYRGWGHELCAHELHEVPVGELRHRVWEGERPGGGHLPAVPGERDLAADCDQRHGQCCDNHQEQDQELPHIQLPLDRGEVCEVGAEEGELGVSIGGARHIARYLWGGGVVTPAAYNRSRSVINILLLHNFN